MRVHLGVEVITEVAPDLIREALLDFSERRLTTWSETLDPDTYVVHWIDETSAEVTEGNRRPKLWSREHYDWSQPNTITWTTQESDFCTPGSSISMVITPHADGGSNLRVTWDRTSVGVKGFIWLLGARIGGRRLLTWATRRAADNIAKQLGS